jgi:hypothetical protein
MKTQSEFRAFVITTVIPKLLDLVKNKGQQYTGEEASVFLNFEQGGEKLGEPKELYLMNLATKQWLVLADWAKTVRFEDIEKRELFQRIFDIIVYMMLLLFMVHIRQDEGDW